MRVALDINETLGIAPDAQSTVDLLAQQAGVLNLQRKGREATAMFDRIDKATAKWEPARRQVYELNPRAFSRSMAPVRSMPVSPRPRRW